MFLDRLALSDQYSGLNQLEASPRVTDTYCLFYSYLTRIITCLFPWKRLVFFPFVRPRTELQSPLAKTSKQNRPQILEAGAQTAALQNARREDRHDNRHVGTASSRLAELRLR